MTRTQPIGGYPFCHVCDIEPQRDQAGAVCLYRPQSRYAKRKQRELHSDGKDPFCKFRIPTGLHQAGVYALIVNGDVRYIGRCTDLSRRFNGEHGTISPSSCYVGGQMTNCRVNRHILNAATRRDKIELWFFDTEDPKEVKRRLMTRLRPPWNKQGRV